MSYVVKKSGKTFYVVEYARRNDKAGLWFREEYDNRADALRAAEYKATMQARRGSGGRKGQHTVVRRGDTFTTVKV